MGIFAQLTPTYQTKQITALTPHLLQKLGIEGLVLDVDNTLTTHDSQEIAPQVVAWLDEMKTAGIAMVILSNNHPQRVEPFAKRIHLCWCADAAKPMGSGYRRAAQMLHLPTDRLLAVGDQLFTDIWGGNRAGIQTLLTCPLAPEKQWFLRFKRVLERPLLRHLKCPCIESIIEKSEKADR